MIYSKPYLFRYNIALCLQEAEFIKDNIFGVYMLAVAITSSITCGYFWGILTSTFWCYWCQFFLYISILCTEFHNDRLSHHICNTAFHVYINQCFDCKSQASRCIISVREKQAETLNSMGRQLLRANNIDEILQITVDSIHDANSCSIVLYMGAPLNPDKTVKKYITEKDELILESILEKQVAQQAFQNDKATGIGYTEASQNCLGTYIPFSKSDKVYGVIGLLFAKKSYINQDIIQFANLMATQTIIALDRQEIVDESQKILLEKEKEKMRSNLLRAISHDLRTPLTCILGSSATLIENKELLQKEEGLRLLSDIHHDAQWLIQMVENLLSVTKISGEGAKLKKQGVVEEIVAEAVGKIQKRFSSVDIRVRVPDELLLVPMDAMLIEQVLINLMENAIRHSGSQKPIYVTIKHLWNRVYFSVLAKVSALKQNDCPIFLMVLQTTANPPTPLVDLVFDCRYANLSSLHMVVKFMQKTMKMVVQVLCLYCP